MRSQSAFGLNGTVKKWTLAKFKERKYGLRDGIIQSIRVNQRAV
jgi:hypothetical protein